MEALTYPKKPEGLTDEQWRDEILRRMLNTLPPKTYRNGKFRKYEPPETAKCFKTHGYKILTKTRKCMSCEKQFQSEGSGHRLCEKCKRMSE